ncbi:hypothetical protein [Paenibacillus alvei]|uniref:hypothetical protein n=1 Tax=Paenibacillus alvei TaxID=44250 RepID=UPI001F2798DA|nr:hypothetical protein [Paenibacillus alvei]
MKVRIAVSRTKSRLVSSDVIIIMCYNNGNAIAMKEYTGTEFENRYGKKDNDDYDKVNYGK